MEGIIVPVPRDEDLDYVEITVHMKERAQAFSDVVDELAESWELTVSRSGTWLSAESNHDRRDDRGREVRLTIYGPRVPDQHEQPSAEELLARAVEIEALGNKIVAEDRDKQTRASVARLGAATGGSIAAVPDVDDEERKTDGDF